MEKQEEKKSWKKKLFREMSEYLVNFIYMALFFGAIVLYRRLILAEHGIIREDYFIGIIKAFVLAKVIMIGGFIRISRTYENKPLIIPTIFKAIWFTLLIMAFDIIEVFIKGFIKTVDFQEAFRYLVSHIDPVWLGASLVIFVSFLPFFALKELSRVMGGAKFKDIFLKKKPEIHSP